MPHLPPASRRDLEIRTVCRIVLHRPFRRLLRRQNIDLTERSWRAFDDMIFRALHRCARCGARDACRQWLAEPHPGEAQPSFCPNASVIEACRILDPHGAALASDGVDAAGPREPPLGELLSDPIIAQLMNADGVEPHHFLSHPRGGSRETSDRDAPSERDAPASEGGPRHDATS